MPEETQCRIKEIPGFPNYKITDDGRLFSKRSGWKQKVGGVMNGYRFAQLWHKGKPVSKMVHRLVAEAFIPNPDNLETVDHIDNVRDNNLVENLRWMSMRDNVGRQRKNGLPHGVQKISRIGYQAQKHINGVKVWSPTFRTPEDASEWFLSLDNKTYETKDLPEICNLWNTGVNKSNKSGVTGVSFHKATRKWRPQIKINKKEIYLGLYDDFENAVCARLAAEQCFKVSGYNSTSTAYQYVKSNITKS